MGASKAEQFTEEQNVFSSIAKALAHPARIAIIEHLLAVNVCICNDIVDELPLSQPTVSQHLNELKNAGLIRGTVDGNTICYCIDAKAVTELREYLDTILHRLKKFEPECC